MIKPIIKSIIVKSVIAIAILMVCFGVQQMLGFSDWTLAFPITLAIFSLIWLLDSQAFQWCRTVAFAAISGILGLLLLLIQHKFLPASSPSGLPAYVIVLAAAWLGSCGWFWQWLYKLREKLGEEPVKIIELLFQVVGFSAIFIAAVELKHNAESLKTANRVQLYTLDTGLSKENFDNPEGKFHSLDAKPQWNINASKAYNVSNYCQQLLGLLCTNNEIIAVTNVQELYGKLKSLKPADYGTNAPPDLVELRKTYSVISQTLDEMHFAYDSWDDGVIDEDELATWFGYIKSMGPHPMFLAVIYNWHEKNYMCNQFADMLRYELKHNNDGSINATNCAVIEYFYTEMNGVNFTNSLPQCGKPWPGWSSEKQKKRQEDLNLLPHTL